MKIKDGEKLTYEFVITRGCSGPYDIDAFAEFSGDKQKIHIDEEFAKKTIFKRPIAHGFLTMMPVTKILGMDVTDEDEYIALKEMNIRFYKPVYVGNKITLVLTLHAEERSNHYLVSLYWQNQNNDIVATGSVPIAILKTKGETYGK